ncbi:hypothetical protein [Burkholderia stabilis]|uniref:hypothetical protein n=1 Tax=Burkholderia stabilis TaxID=95485 RepID=UPI0015922979|nr:hypothetical protein [Burkholderia stabilis]
MRQIDACGELRIRTDRENVTRRTDPHAKTGAGATAKHGSLVDPRSLPGASDAPLSHSLQCDQFNSFNNQLTDQRQYPGRRHSPENHRKLSRNSQVTSAESRNQNQLIRYFK